MKGIMSLDVASIVVWAATGMAFIVLLAFLIAMVRSLLHMKKICEKFRKNARQI